MFEQVGSIAQRELGACPRSVSRVEEGLLHETYELSCDGMEYILQFAGTNRAEQLARGLYWYRLLRDSGIRVPRVVTAEPGTYDGRAYALVEKLPGTSGEREITPERTANAGRCLAKIHRIALDADGQSTRGFEWREPPDGRPDTEHVVCVLREHGLEMVADRLERQFPRSVDSQTSECVLCHGDFSPDNVLFRGSEVTGVIDFDRAHVGHGQRDLVRAANAFWMHDPCSDWAVPAAFYEGYREARDPGPSFEQREPRYRVETLADTVAGMLELGAFSAYEREFYAEALSDALDRVG